MRIALTGATGFLGQALAAALLRDGHDLVVLTRRATRAPSHPRTQFVTWTPGSGRDLATVRDFLGHADLTMTSIYAWSDDTSLQTAANLIL